MFTFAFADDENCKVFVLLFMKSTSINQLNLFDPHSPIDYNEFDDDFYSNDYDDVTSEKIVKSNHMSWTQSTVKENLQLVGKEVKF